MAIYRAKCGSKVGVIGPCKTCRKLAKLPDAARQAPPSPATEP